MKRELGIFMGIFLFLAIGMHFKVWISHPLEHIMALSKAGAYGLGPLHPLIITGVVYIFIAAIRGIAHLFDRS